MSRLSFRDARDGQSLSAVVGKAIGMQRAMRKGLDEGEIRRIILHLDTSEEARETFETLTDIEVFTD